VQLEAVAEDRLMKLVEEHFDIAIRVNPCKDSKLVGRCFAKDRLALAAAPSVQIPKGRSDSLSGFRGWSARPFAKVTFGLPKVGSPSSHNPSCVFLRY